MYYAYVPQSTKDGNLYTGFTENLKLRFEQHNKGLVESIKDRRPFELIYYEACLNQNDAVRREKYLKTFHGKMFLRRRLKSYLTGQRVLEDFTTKKISNFVTIAEDLFMKS